MKNAKVTHSYLSYQETAIMVIEDDSCCRVFEGNPWEAFNTNYKLVKKCSVSELQSVLDEINS